MNVNPTTVTNAAKLSLFMVNLPQLLMCDFRQTDPVFGVPDLKSYYRECRYVTEILKMLPKKTDDILLPNFYSQFLPL
jgi:hypothetical protein